jgi:hypothetical protein
MWEGKVDRTHARVRKENRMNNEEMVARHLGTMMRRVDMLVEQILDAGVPGDEEDLKSSFKILVEGIVARADKAPNASGREVFTPAGMQDCIDGYDAIRVLLENAMVAGAAKDA